MRNDFEISIEDRPETNLGDVEDFFPESSIGSTNQAAKESSKTPTTPLLHRASARERAKQPDEYIKRLGPETLATPLDESRINLFIIEERIRSEIREIIRSEFRQIPEIHWVQNLQHLSYHLRQPIPILIVIKGDAVTATYDDIELSGRGASVKEAKSNLCANIVSRYEEFGKSAPKSQEFTFLKRIIEEVEPPAWRELKQLYREKLEEFSHVQKGYIRIDGNNAEVVILLSEESVEIIMELAQLDLEINQKFPSLSFSAEYELTEDYLELGDFECFHKFVS